MSKLIAQNQTTLMNLMERAETRKETFYKLTNSSDVPERFERIAVVNENLYIKSRSSAGYITIYSESLGGPTQYNERTSDFIPVSKNEKYVFQGWVTVPENGYPWHRYHYYDADKHKVGSPYYFESNTSLAGEQHYAEHITVPDNDSIAYIRISARLFSDGKVKFEKGDVATPYSQAPEYLGWSTTTLVPTQSNRYLWKFEYVYYSDGSVETTQPVNISIAGTDGMTSYIHLAYANSSDGRTGFSFTDTKQQYQGYYTDFTQVNSTDPTKYTWMDRRAGVEVGGVNLIKQSTAQKGLRLSMGTQPLADTNHMLTDWIEVEPSTTYTLTTYEDVDEANMYYSLAWYSSNANDYSGWISLPTGALSATDLKGGKQYTSPSNATYAKVSYPNNYPKIKLERGNIATGHEQAPEDIEKEIDTKADQELTQEQINALNEKNQILETEMQAKASMEAFSEFEKAYQSFVKSNAEGQAKAEADLIEAGRRIELLTTQFGGFAELKTFIDTYMSSSNEGLIIGKNDASSTIKVSSDRISMFSAGKEVMYISQGVINIDNGIFTVSVQIGKFRTEQYELNADMNVIRYVG
ncbi:TPA: hypothetical protein ACGO2M_000752 [Streptococcus suis]